MPPCGHLIKTEFKVAFCFQGPISVSRQQAAADFQYYWEHHLCSLRKDRYSGNCFLTWLCRSAAGKTTESGQRLMQPCDLYHHVYPAMSNLHSKQHPTEDIVTIKYASLMYLFKRKADFSFIIILKNSLWQNWVCLTAAPKRWINKFGSFSSSLWVIWKVYCRLILQGQNFQKQAFIGWIASFRFKRKFFQLSFRSVQQTPVHCKFRLMSGNTNLNTAIKLLCF